MSKKHKHEEHVNHERWLVSYADFITLLFAFFVVMYSISSVNDGKYRVLSDSLQASFEGSPKSLTPIQFGNVEKSYKSAQSIMSNNSISSQEENTMPQGSDPTVKELGEALRNALQSRVKTDDVSIRETPESFEVEMKAASLFSSGSATLSQSSDRLIEPLGNTLSKFENPVTVEGFTDNIPIRNDLFPSNWELSVARSAAVVRRLISFGVLPDRMAAIGYSDNFPVADNDTEDGRRQNRRVIIVIYKMDKRDRLKKTMFVNGREKDTSLDDELVSEASREKNTAVKAP